MSKKLNGCLLVVLLSLLHCKEKKCYDPTNVECENYNPCHGKATADATFSGVTKTLFRTHPLVDTVAANHVFVFSASQKFDHYTWKIGSDTNKWNSPDFKISIGQHLGWVPITLIAKRPAEVNSFLNDDGIDTFTKSIYVVKQQESKVHGRWKGALENQPNDTFTINVFVSDTSYQEPEYIEKGLSYVSNFPKNYQFLLKVLPLYDHMVYEDLSGYDPACKCAAGYIYASLIDHNTIRIEFKSYDPSSGTWIDRIFMGKRV